MNDTLKKLTDENRFAIVASIASKAVADLMAMTKSDSSDAGTFRVIVSTADVDRQGESVDQGGWDLAFYKQNPVVLWAHDYSSLPIGVCTSIEVKDGKLIAEGKFAPASANPFAQQIRKLYELGMVNTTSVGFIPKEYNAEKQGVISKSELLEFSFVPVPANPYALRLDQIKQLGIDTAMLKTKGLEVKEEPEDPPAPAPEQEKPAETAKGEVADEVAIGEAQEKKWQKYMEVCEALDAFCTVYFDEATPVEDFGKLLTETISILTQVASAGGMSDDDMKTALSKQLGERKALSIKQALMAVIRNHVALGSLELSEGDKNGKKKENPAAPNRSINADGLKDLNGFVESRELLRDTKNTIDKVLHNFNLAARKR